MKKRVLLVSLCLVMFLVLSNVTGEFHSPDLTSVSDSDEFQVLNERTWIPSELPEGAVVTNNQEDYIDQLSDLYNESDIGTHSSFVAMQHRDGTFNTLTSDNITIYSNQTSYESWQLDLEIAWTDVDHNEINGELCVFGGTQAAESLRVDIWANDGWINVIDDVEIGWNNVSIAQSLTDETLEMRFVINVGDNTSVQNSWDIDAVLIHTWTTVYSSELTQNGVIQDVGNNLSRYITSVGEQNTWDSETDTWHRYLYDPETKTVKIGNLTITHLPGGALSIDGDTGSRVGKLSWYIQYYYNDVWQNLTLTNYQFVGFTKTTENVTAHQRFWDVQGEMNVYLTYSYSGGFKTSVEIRNDAAIGIPIRAIWAAQDVRGIQDNYRLLYNENEVLYGIQIEDAVFSWNDVIASDNPLPTQTVIDKPSRRAAVIFGNQSTVIPSGYTTTIDPTYTVEHDQYDNYWDDWEGTRNRYDGVTINKLETDGSSKSYQPTYSIALAIPKYAIITSAITEVYVRSWSGATTATVYRLNTANAGVLEGAAWIDTDFSLSSSMQLTGTLRWEDADIGEIVQKQINLATWTSGWRIGLRVRVLSVSQHTVEDFSHAETHHPKITITYMAPSENWLSGYSYRQGHSIDGSDGAGELYQVKLNVEYGPGTSSGGTIYCNSKCETDFDDVHITDATGNTELDYWLEEKTDSDDATFWVEVSADLGSDQIIYVYYGKTGDSSDSNGPNTFILFDDFNDESIDTDLWDTDGATESGGIMSIAVGSKYIKSDATYGPDVAVSARTSQAMNSRHNFGFGSAVPFTATMWIRHCWDGAAYLFEGNADTDNIAYADGSYDTETLYWKEDYGGHTYGGTTLWQSDGDISGAAMYVGGQTWGSSTTAYLMDWIFIRNWIVTEPASYTWTEEETQPPVNDQAPTLDNPSDTDNMYAHYVKYQITSYASSVNGFAFIDYLEIGLWNDAQSTEYWRGRYDEDTNEFSGQYLEEVYVDLDTVSSTATELGNDIEATFYITVDWDFADQSDLDVKCYVIDSATRDDEDWYETTIDVETRTDYSEFALDDGSGTAARGDYDTENGITADGTVIYFGSALHPPTDTVDTFVWASFIAGSPWTDTSLVDGYFEMTVDSDDEVGIDQYNFRVVPEGGAWNDPDLCHEYHETMYIADRIQVQGYEMTPDGRVNIGANIIFKVELHYLYDSTDVTDGTITVNERETVYYASGKWQWTDNEASVTSITYDTVAVTGDTHGVTKVDQNGQSSTGIWDRVQISTTTVADNRVNIDDNVNIDFTLIYDYDNAEVTDGTVTIEGFAASHIGSGVWRITRTSASVTSVLYNEVTATGNTHGITEVDMNGQSETVIWDRIYAVSLSYGGDTRVDMSTSINFDYELHYDYDESDVTDGTITINGETFTHQGGGIWRFTSDGGDAVGDITFDAIVPAGNTHDITVAITDGNDVTLIWDRVQVQSYTVVDTRVNINDNVNVDVLLWYDYDNTQLTDGTVTINGYAASHQGSGVWRITRTSASVTSVTYNNVQCSGNTHGITVEDQNGQSEEVIWDRVQVQSYSVSDARDDINDDVNIDFLVYYDYDNTPVTDGDFTLNGFDAAHLGDGWWRITRTSASVTSVTYNTVIVTSANTHGITVEDQNGQSQEVIWDRVQISTTSASDNRDDINDDVNIDFTLIYDYDNAEVTDGTVTIEGFAASHIESGVWRITRTSASVTSVLYNEVTATGNTHGITEVDMNGQSETVIWDRIQVQSYSVSDARVNVDDNVNTDVWIIYDYDNTDVTDGTTTINGIEASHQGDGVWRITRSFGFVGSETYTLVQSTGNTHGITEEDQNGQSQQVIWDRIQVQTTVVDDGRVDIDSSVEIRVTLWLDFDDTYLGSGDSVTLDGTAMSWDAANSWFDLARSQSTVGVWLYFVNSSSETTYGITALDLNSQEVSVIWDRVVLTLTSNLSWTIIDYNVTLSATGIYDYDSTAWSGTITWADRYPSESTVESYDYGAAQITSITDSNYGLTLFIMGTETSVIFDDVVPSGGVAHSWMQYSTTQVYLIWAIGSNWMWDYNDTLLNVNVVFHVYSNSSSPESSGGTYGSGSFGGLTVGPYTPDWYYVDLDVNCEVTISGVDYDWLIWQEVLSVDILHSLQIVTFSIEPTDYHFWITFQTSLLNASITMWDDAMHSGTLFADNIYHEDIEGMHQMDRSTIIAVHNMTICITSTGTDYDRDYTVHDYVWWYNFTYIVTDPPAYDCHLVILNNLYELIQFDTFEVYNNDTRIYHDIIQVVEGYSYNITVKNRFGDTVNSAVFDADYEMVIFVNTYSFKFMNWYNGFLRVNVTRAGVTYSEIIMPMERIEFNLFAETYVFSVDFLNGTTKFSQEIEVSNSTGYVITGDSLTDVFDLVNSVYAMTTAINITVESTNNYALTISIDLDNINATIGSQLVQVLLNITNTNSTIYDQTVDLLALLQNTNSTLYNQTVDILVELNYISSNVTANFISVSAVLSMIDSSLLSNFTSVTSTLSAIGSNITTNYLDVVATLTLIDSQMSSNFTNIVAQLLSVNSSIASQFITVIAYAVEMNTTMYLIDDPTHLNPLVLGYSLSDDYCDFTVVTTWHNATIDIYDNNVKQAGPISELLSPIRYTLQTTPGTHNLSLFIDAGVDSFWYNISYTLAEIILRYNTLSFVGDELTVTVTIHSNWGNGTITITDENGAYVRDQNDLEMNNRPEGSYTFKKITTDGFHDYTVTFDAGADGNTWDLQYSFEEEKIGSGFNDNDLEKIDELLNDTLDDIKDELDVWRPSPEDFLMLGSIIILVVIVIGQWARNKRKDDRDSGTFGWLGLSFPKLKSLPKPRWFSKPMYLFYRIISIKNNGVE